MYVTPFFSTWFGCMACAAMAGACACMTCAGACMACAGPCMAGTVACALQQTPWHTPMACGHGVCLLLPWRVPKRLPKRVYTPATKRLPKRLPKRLRECGCIASRVGCSQGHISPDQLESTAAHRGTIPGANAVRAFRSAANARSADGTIPGPARLSPTGNQRKRRATNAAAD